MARVILGSSTPQIAVPTLSTQSTAKTVMSPPSLESRLRQRRSSKYIETIKQLQAAQHFQDTEAQETLVEAIRQEFPEMSISAFPLLCLVFQTRPGYPRWMPTPMIAEATTGMLRQDLQAELINKARQIDSYDAAVMQACAHYNAVLPGFVSRAFILVEHDSYAFVEIYPEYLVAIASNGDTSLVR